MKSFLFISLASLSLMACTTTPSQAAKPAVQSVNPMSDGLVTKPSAHSVSVTIDRLEAAAKAKGLNVFIRIDHQQNAAKMGLEMHPSTLLILGSPKIGSPLMNAAPSIGIDLPVKALAYEKDGKVYLVYNDPAYLQTRHGLTDAQSAPLTKMSKVVGGLTDKAVTAD